MLNKVMLIGHLGKDPESRRMQNGNAVVSFALAVSERWRDKASGERKERTEWVNIVIFNEGLAKVAEDYLRKGSKCYIEGKMQTRKWQDKSGADRWSTEVVLQAYQGSLELLDGRQEDRDGDERNHGGSDRSAPARRAPPAGEKGSAYRPSANSLIDEDIPFNCEWR